MTAGSMPTALELRGGEHVTCHVLKRLLAARSRHGAGSTLTGELKEHRSQQRGKLFTCHFQGKMQFCLRHLPRMVAWCGVPECASAVFLEENGALFTITSEPRMCFQYTGLNLEKYTVLLGGPVFSELSPVITSVAHRGRCGRVCGM